jgi:hypothetical protein
VAVAVVDGRGTDFVLFTSGVECMKLDSANGCSIVVVNVAAVVVGAAVVAAVVADVVEVLHACCSCSIALFEEGNADKDEDGVEFVSV